MIEIIENDKKFFGTLRIKANGDIYEIREVAGGIEILRPESIIANIVNIPGVMYIPRIDRG